MVFQILINDVAHKYCRHCDLYHPLNTLFWGNKRGKLGECKIRVRQYRQSSAWKKSLARSNQKNWAVRMVISSRREDKKRNRYNPVGFIDKHFLEMQLILQNSRCFYCGSQMEYGVGFSRRSRRGLTVERLDNSKGHLKTNCVFCCCGCQSINHPQNKKRKVS